MFFQRYVVGKVVIIIFVVIKVNVDADLREWGWHDGRFVSWRVGGDCGRSRCVRG